MTEYPSKALGLLLQWNPPTARNWEFWNNSNGLTFMFFYGFHGGTLDEL